MNQVREIQRINEEELNRGLAGTPASWHTKYANSAWVFVGNLDNKLSEGDVIAVLSEYGEVEDLHLIREEDTGKSKGFCFCKYEDNRSCVLVVDNLCGFDLLGRSMRVDHVENYRLPKNLQEKEEELQKRLAEGQGLEGHAYEGVELANQFSLQQGHDVFAKPAAKVEEKKVKEEDEEAKRRKQEKKKDKEEKRMAKESRKRERDKVRAEREEKRREKRAKTLQEKGDDGDADERKRSKKHHKRSSEGDEKRYSKKHKKSGRRDSDEEDRKHSKKDKKSSRDEDKKRSKKDKEAKKSSSDQKRER